MALDPKNTLRGQARLAWLEFADMHRAANHSPRTIETYGEALAQLQLWLDTEREGLDLLEATRRTLGAFLAWVTQTRSAATSANRYRALVQFFKWAAREDIVTASPMAGVECPKHEYALKAVLTDEQLAALLATCRGKSFEDIRDNAMLRILCEPGSPRASELAALDVADFDMDAKTILIRNGKGGKTRPIGMSASTSRAVFRYLRARASHRLAAGPAMFLGLKGRLSRSGVNQMTGRRGELAGIGHIGPHQLRHTAFADFDAAGASVNASMALFGWSSPAMAHHYGKQARQRTALAAAAQMSRADRLDGALR